MIKEGMIWRWFVALLAMFMPLMFMFSKSLVDSVVGCKQCEQCEGKRRIIRFNAYSTIYLQCFSYFIIFALLKILIGVNHELWNTLYFAVMFFYMLLEDFTVGDNNEDIMLMLIPFLLFCVLPSIVWTVLWLVEPQNMLTEHSVASFEISTLYLLIWLFLPVWFHPLRNLYELKTKCNGRNP